jgi:excisionase family DNA binding protein
MSKSRWPTEVEESASKSAGGRDPAVSPSPLLTVSDLASYLSLSARGARQVLERRDLPGFRIGKRWYVRREDLDAAVAAKAARSRRDPEAAVRILRGLPGSRKARRKP